jgi:hypothetical protein
MMTHKPLGHRANPRRQPLRARESFDAASPGTKFVFAEASIDQMSVAQREIVPLQESPELREWKQARKNYLKTVASVVTDGVTLRLAPSVG